LYEDFSQSNAKQEVATLVTSYGEHEVAEANKSVGGASTHVFQVL
jgi:hypothetical protein